MKQTIVKPLWHQVITYSVVLFFCAITICSVVWMINLLRTEGFPSIGGIPVITFFSGYSAYVGLLLLRYGVGEVTYDENGFTVNKKGDTSRYTWSDITKTKYYGILRVLRLFRADGRTVYAIHGQIRHHRTFINKISEKVGFTTDVF
ncbi:MAG: hypothetical protein AAFZ89_16890 [Bacteroidota bacterium]